MLGYPGGKGGLDPFLAAAMQGGYYAWPQQAQQQQMGNPMAMMQQPQMAMGGAGMHPMLQQLMQGRDPSSFGGGAAMNAGGYYGGGGAYGQTQRDIPGVYRGQADLNLHNMMQLGGMMSGVMNPIGMGWGLARGPYQGYRGATPQMIAQVQAGRSLGAVQHDQRAASNQGGYSRGIEAHDRMMAGRGA